MDWNENRENSVKTLKRWGWIISKTGFTFLLIFWLVKKTGIDALKESFNGLGFPFIIAIVLAIGFNILKAMKWHYLLNGVGMNVSSGNTIKSYLVGMAGGLLTPGRVGEIARLAYLNGFKKSSIIILVMVDKWVDLLVILFLALPGVFYFGNGFIFILFGLMTLAMIGLYFFPGNLIKWIRMMMKTRFVPFKLKEKIEKILEKIPAVGLKFKTIFFFITLSCYILVLIEFYFLLEGKGYGSTGIALTVQPLVMLTNMFPVTIAGLGVREGSAAILTASWGIPAPVAIHAAFMLFILNTVMPAILGVFFVLTHRVPQTNNQIEN